MRPRAETSQGMHEAKRSFVKNPHDVGGMQRALRWLCGHPLLVLSVLLYIPLVPLLLNARGPRDRETVWILALIANPVLLGIAFWLRMNVRTTVAHHKAMQTPLVKNERPSGRVTQVEAWLREHVCNPDSLVIEQWGSVERGTDGNLRPYYAVDVKWRAMNWQGGYDRETTTFKLDAYGTVFEGPALPAEQQTVGVVAVVDVNALLDDF